MGGYTSRESESLSTTNNEEVNELNPWPLVTSSKNTASLSRPCRVRLNEPPQKEKEFRTLGEGGFGSVSLVAIADPRLFNGKALWTARKVFFPPKGEDEEETKDEQEELDRVFQNEVVALELVSGIPIYSAFRRASDGAAVIYSAFLDGHPVIDLMGQGNWQSALLLFATLLEWLQFSHSQGVSHRDIKPDNVIRNTRDSLLGETFTPVDWGLSCAITASSIASPSSLDFILGTCRQEEPPHPANEAIVSPWYFQYFIASSRQRERVLSQFDACQPDQAGENEDPRWRALLERNDVWGAALTTLAYINGSLYNPDWALLIDRQSVRTNGLPFRSGWQSFFPQLETHQSLDQALRYHELRLPSKKPTEEDEFMETDQMAREYVKKGGVLPDSSAPITVLTAVLDQALDPHQPCVFASQLLRSLRENGNQQVRDILDRAHLHFVHSHSVSHSVPFCHPSSTN